MSEHTPGLMIAATGRTSYSGALPPVLKVGGYQIAVVETDQVIYTPDGNEVDESAQAALDAANAERLAAAWNHCAGVPTHIITMAPHPPLRVHLEDACAGAAELRAKADDLRRQRDELAAAARTVLAGLDRRIRDAAEAGEPVPVFGGIADLHDALNRCIP